MLEACRERAGERGRQTAHVGAASDSVQSAI